MKELKTMSILDHTELYTVNNICNGCGGKVTVYKNLDGFTAECYSNKCIDSAISDEFTKNFMYKSVPHAQEAVNRWNAFIINRKIL